MVTRWLPWLLLAASLVVGSAAAPPATVIARLFFIGALGGGVVAALGVAGRTAQVAAAGVLLALTIGQSVLQRPIAQPPSSQWTVALSEPAQRLRHTLTLPLGSESWRRWWERASGAAIYVCARGPLTEEDRLDLYLNDRHLTRITQAQAVGPRPQPTSVGFYRVPVERAALESAPSIVLELRRAPDAAQRAIDVCGTFTHRPTAGLESSAFFDGTRWTSPGPSQQGRYIIELRLEEAPGRAVAALY